MDVHTAPEAAEETNARASDSVQARLQRYYVLFMLLLVTSLSMLDRRVMGMLVEPVRAELQLSDGQVGLVTGLAFAVSYAAFSIPAARLADKWSRVNVISLAIGVWCAMTALCGAAINGVTLFLARFGVGFGEAGGSPPAQAYIGDLFPRHERATAMSILTVASPLGIAGGLWLGGWGQEAFGWRGVFLLAALPGILLVPLVFFTFPRVPPGMVDGGRQMGTSKKFVPAVKELVKITTLPLMFAGAALQTILGLGMIDWLPAFFQRTHNLEPAAIGGGLAAALGTGSLIGHLAGGPLSDLLGKKDIRWHFWIPMITSIVSGALALCAFVAPVEYAFPLLGVQVAIFGLFAGPVLAIMMNLSPISSRATAAALFMVCMSGIGMGAGPALIGVLSDLLRPWFEADSLRVALMCSTALMIPAAILFFVASVTYRDDLANADARNKAEAQTGG